MLAFGCAKGTDTTPEDDNVGTGASASTFCEGYCARVHTCDEGKDEKTCTNACTNANAATLPKLRGDIVDLMSSCIDDADCKTVLEGGVIATCSEEATAKVKPSDAATSFCDARTKAAKKCDGETETAACLTTAKLYNDAALKDATDCTEKACADIEECIDAALGSLTSTGTGSSSGTGDGTATKDAGKDAKPATPTCTGVDTTSACGECTAGSCCEEYTACAANTNCTNWMTCFSQCTPSDSTCKSDCDYYYSTGKTLGSALATCLQGSCSSDCTN